MPVSIPKLQRIQPTSDMPSNDRIKMQVPDNSQEIMQRTNAITGVAEKGVDLYYDIEDSKITQLSSEAEQKYAAWNSEQLARLKSYKGDPTDGYAEYDKLAKEKRDEILAERPDLNDRMKTNISANLDKAIGQQNIHVLKQRGAQIETYKNDIYESGLKLKKTDLGNNIGYVNAKDPGSFLPMDQNIADIKTAIAKRGFDTGLAKKLPDDATNFNHFYKDESGKLVKVELTPMAQQKAAKELSEGVKDSLSAMLATATTEEGKANYEAAYERYKSYLDPKGIAALNKNHSDTLTNDTAFKEAGRIEMLSPDKRNTEIDKITDEKIKSKVLGIISTNENRRNQLKKLQEDTNYDRVAKEVLKGGMYGVSDLENNPVYKQVENRLNSKQIEALRDSVIAPKNSDPKSEARMQNLIFGNDPDNKLEGMSPEKFMEYKRGLNKSDQNKYENYYNRLNTQSSGEERATHKRAEEFLRDQLVHDKYISKDDYGRITGKNDIKLIEAKRELLNYLSTAPKSMNDTQLMNYVQDYSAKKIKGEIFTPAEKPTFNPPPVKKESNAIIPPSKQNVVTSSTSDDEKKILAKLAIQYNKDFKGWPDQTSKEWADYVKSHR